MIISIVDYKEFQGISSPNQDNKLQPLVDLSNSLIENYCNTKFEPTVVLNEVLSPYRNTILVDNAPIISLQDVTFIEPTETVLDLTTDIKLHKDSGEIIVINKSLSIPTTSYSVKVSYTHGFAEAPYDIRLAAMELVNHYDKREFNRSKDLGNGQAIDFSDSQVIPAQVKAVLDLYKVL